MVPNDEQRHTIDRLHDSMIDVGKRINGSLGRLVVVMGIALVVTFGSSTNAEDQIEVPVIGIGLEKWPASYVLCVLASALGYQTVALHLHLTNLRLHLTDLRKEVGWSSIDQIDIYPTLLTLSRRSRLEARLSRTVTLLLAGLLFSPFPLIIYAGVEGGVSAFFIVSLLLVCVLTTATAVAAWAMVSRLATYFGIEL